MDRIPRENEENELGEQTEGWFGSDQQQEGDVEGHGLIRGAERTTSLGEDEEDVEGHGLASAAERTAGVAEDAEDVEGHGILSREIDRKPQDQRDRYMAE